MSEIEHFPFDDDMALAAFNGMKFCTSRNKTYGRKGDTFYIGLGGTVKWFEIIAIERLPLAYVAKCLYFVEGFKTEEEFINKWMKLHPVKGWLPSQEVYVHWFRPKYIDPFNWA